MRLLEFTSFKQTLSL